MKKLWYKVLDLLFPLNPTPLPEIPRKPLEIVHHNVVTYIPTPVVAQETAKVTPLERRKHEFHVWKENNVLLFGA